MSFSFFFLFAAVFVLVGAGCNRLDKQENSSSLSVTFNNPFTLAKGQTVQMAVDDTTVLSLTFVNVENDSRCPTDVQCIRAGEAIIQVQASLTSAPIQDLLLDTSAMESVEYENYLIRILELTPVPTSGTQIEQSDYRVSLSVSKKTP